MMFQIILNVLLLIAVSADSFSSLASLKALIGAERDIPVMINAYVEKELEKLDYLKKFAQEIQESNNKAIRDGEEAITHPINAFLLIKGMTTDWNKVIKIMRSNSADDFIRNVTNQRIIKRINYPTEVDLSGAAIGILRLQDTYEMNTKDIADGKILNSKMRTVALTAGDCFEIGRVAYSENDYYHAILWMQEARERIQKETKPTADPESILDHLAFSLYKQGNLKRALLLTDELYRMNPDHPRAKGNVRWYEDLLEDEGIRRADMRRKVPPMNNPRDKSNLKDTYEALCRQEVPINTKAQSRLYCYYKMDRPYLRLAPFKVEIVHQNPLVVLFRDIVSDEEMRIIEMLAVPKLARATVHNVVTGNIETAFYRTSQNSWLGSTEHEVVKRINKRLDLATNLETETAEELQVQNYGIGGHYEPHYDCSRRENVFEKTKNGNRIATILIYMTEPEIGGGTVFIDLKTSVSCTKNAALFWYNLMRSGAVDMRSYHAACPVLTGTKWTANKWFHESGQEWRRPCGLNQLDQERYVGDLGAPEPKRHLNIRSEKARK
ncbi:Prolyl 4-hydroxylase subunit alpha-1 [Brugia pahangi]